MEDHVCEYNISNVSTCSAAAAASSSSLVHTNNSHHPSSSDEISLFLNQILNRSSSASTTAATTWTSGMAHTGPYAVENAHRLSKSAGISAIDSVDVLTGGAGYFSGNASGSGANVSSSSFGVSENENTDEHDWESEEGNEALVSDVPAKPALPRCSSKRSRAAEVHNLSEKRRRSRINEKMKALQNLIPNSNKTDKASMLDEAIEYLKQLQLQVQMLTLRNGLSLHPMCLPGALQPIQFPQMRMGFGAEIGSLHMNSTGTVVNQENPMQNVFNLPNHRTSSNQLQVPNMSHIIHSETSFGLESSIPTNFRSYKVGASSRETCREEMLPHHQLNVSHSVTNPSGASTTNTVVFPFSTQGSGLKDSGSLESCTVGRDQARGVHLKNIDRDPVFFPHLTGMQTGRRFLGKNMKSEKKDF